MSTINHPGDLSSIPTAPPTPFNPNITAPTLRPNQREFIHTIMHFGATNDIMRDRLTDLAHPEYVDVLSDNFLLAQDEFIVDCVIVGF